MKRKYAYVTFVMRNDSFVPGALMLGYTLKKYQTQYDKVCLVTKEVSDVARDGLACVFDKVIEVETIEIYHQDRQERQDRPYLFTRFQALRLGKNGDLGCDYEKILLMDADLLPLCSYDHLFDLKAPAGIINEYKEHCIAKEDIKRNDQKSVWHDHYDHICPHGSSIPRALTDKVWSDDMNMGVNASLWLLSPSMEEYKKIFSTLKKPDILEKVSRFKWPEMQFGTYYWSGRWTSIDIRYSAFNSMPSFKTIYGNHYAGLKPWNEKKVKSLKHYAKFNDYKYWYRQFERMVKKDFPNLMSIPKVNRVYKLYANKLK